MTTEVTSINDKKRRNRKKKNTRFLRNAKGFAKKGIYGRGTHIDDDQYTYYINILDAMKEGFEDLEEKYTMSNNVFAQTLGQEVHLASNQIVCKVLESLLGFIEAEHLERYCETFASNFRPLCSDRFASHILQKLVEISFLRAMGKENVIHENNSKEIQLSAKRIKVDILSEENYNLDTEFPQEHRQKCVEFVERMSKFLLNNLEDFVWDPCANHIIRTCLLSLAGVYVPKVAFEKGRAGGGGDWTKKLKLFKVSSQWLEILREFPRRLEMWPQLSDLPYEEHTSALLGIICQALKVKDKNMLKHFGKQILMLAFLKVENSENENHGLKIEILDEKDQKSEEKTNSKYITDVIDKTELGLPKVFHCQSATILLETLLSVAGPKLLTQLYAMLFTGRIALLAKEPLTNFSVQKLLQNIKVKEDFEEIFSELVEHIETLLKIGHTGVVEGLGAACLRLSTKQAQFFLAMQSALHVLGDKAKSKYIFHCLLKLKPYEIMLDENSTFVHLHGSLIVQHLLRFNKPIFLVNCILDSSPDQLIIIFNTPNGSHIADAFLQSKYIGEKSREKLIRQLEGFYVDLAVTKFGSRIVEHCFAVGQDAQKVRIVKELADKANMLKGSPFGRLLYHKFRIETYRLSASQWKASLEKKENKAELLFKDIIK